MKDSLYELDIDLVSYGKDIVMRKLLITYLSLQLAQTIGIDHHAAKEELYYYMRTKDNETHTMLTEFMDHFYEKVSKDEKSASDNAI
jgi:nanoRNase/pAp phosphatase (c-di-AMP/oligoRNAs hydrolase)